MISETSREYFSISSFGQKHEASFTMFWFYTNCTNFVWLTGIIFQNTPYLAVWNSSCFSAKISIWIPWDVGVKIASDF